MLEISFPSGLNLLQGDQYSSGQVCLANLALNSCLEFLLPNVNTTIYTERMFFYDNNMMLDLVNIKAKQEGNGAQTKAFGTGYWEKTCSFLNPSKTASYQPAFHSRMRRRKLIFFKQATGSSWADKYWGTLRLLGEWLFGGQRNVET